MSRASPELNRLAGYLHGAEQEVLEVPRLGQGKLVEAADAALIPPGFRLDATYSSARTRRKNLVYTYLYRELSATVDLPFRDVVFEGVPDPRVEVFDAGVVGADADAPALPSPWRAGSSATRSASHCRRWSGSTTRTSPISAAARGAGVSAARICSASA